MLDLLDRAGFLAVDEIDSSLHPLIVSQLVDLFQSGESNPNGARLLFTDHGVNPSTGVWMLVCRLAERR